MLRAFSLAAAALSACTPAQEKNVVSAPAQPAAGTPLGKGDTRQEAEGRLILSTALVRVGPDRLLTVVTTDGRTLLLRDVTMHARNYCGVEQPGDRRFCEGYANIAEARPGGAPIADQPDLARENPLKP